MRHLRASWQSWHGTEALDRLSALSVILGSGAEIAREDKLHHPEQLEDGWHGIIT